MIGEAGRKVDILPSLGVILEDVTPAQFEANSTIALTGSDLNLSGVQVFLASEPLTITPPATSSRLNCVVNGPIAAGALLSAGSHPLFVRQTLPSGRFRSSNLLIGNLLPAVTTATPSGLVNVAGKVRGNLQITGRLLGTPSDDIVVAFRRRHHQREPDPARSHRDGRPSAALRQLPDHCSRQRPAGEKQSGGRLELMTSTATMATPVTFTPGLEGGAVLGNYWLRQVTYRLRREVCWLWQERGALARGGSLPPFAEKLSTALDLTRYADEKKNFFASDETARWPDLLLFLGDQVGGTGSFLSGRRARWDSTASPVFCSRSACCRSWTARQAPSWPRA